MKLNMGCGRDYRKDYVNVDNFSDFKDAKVDMVLDLDKLPYPFKDGTADEVYMNHVLEHLENPRAVMKEIHRVLGRNGRFVLNVPYFARGYSVHVHTKGFSIFSVLEDTKNEFVPEKVMLIWDYPETFRRGAAFLRPFCRIWNWIINRNHWFSERFLAYKFGGILEARFVLVKK